MGARPTGGSPWNCQDDMGQAMMRHTIGILCVTFAVAVSGCNQEEAKKGKNTNNAGSASSVPKMAMKKKISQETKPSAQTTENSDSAAAELRAYLKKTNGGPHGKNNPHSKLSPEQRVQVALQHLAEGRRGEALESLGRGIGKHPNHPQLRGIRASLFLQDKQYAKALADLEVALKATPDDPLLLVNRAQAYRGFKRDEAALADLNRALDLNPKLVGAQFNRGTLFFQQGKYKEALADFEQCVAIDPHAAAPRFNLAMTLDAVGERDKAVGELENFLKTAKHEGWRKIAEKQLQRWGKIVAKVEPKNSETSGDKTTAQTYSTPDNSKKASANDQAGTREKQ